jgi:hypothetical protein
MWRMTLLWQHRKEKQLHVRKLDYSTRKNAMSRMLLRSCSSKRWITITRLRGRRKEWVSPSSIGWDMPESGVTIKHTLGSYHHMPLYAYTLPFPWSNMPRTT